MGKKKMGKALAKVVEPALDKSPEFTKVEDDILWTLAEGRSPSMVAKQLAPDDRARQTAIKRKIYRMFHSMKMQDELAARLQLMAIMGLGPAMKALNRKAAAGRVDAIKLLFEASKFYNPRVQHEHGGEIEIVIKNARRPERVVEEYIGDRQLSQVIDAQVVED